MLNTLKQHIEKYIRVNEQDYAGILNFFDVVHAKKKENLLSEGKICRSNYFVVKGCLRLFFIKENGVEQTTQFTIENWWVADYTSFEKQQPSGFYLQAVEKSDVLAITYQHQEEMLQQFPQMERYFRLMHQRANAAAQFRIKGLYGQSREDLYRQFNNRYPEFVQRIPQYLLASFLGFTPEYLSELRSKKLS